MPSIAPLRITTASVVFWIHFIIFLLFPLGFFIPSSIWPERIEVHFWFCISLFILFYAWGALWTIRFRDKVYAVCMLDTVMQWLLGFSIWDRRNYNHSFVEELFARLGIIHIPKKYVPRLLLICIFFSSILFILKRNNVLLW